MHIKKQNQNHLNLKKYIFKIYLHFKNRWNNYAPLNKFYQFYMSCTMCEQKQFTRSSKYFKMDKKGVHL